MSEKMESNNRRMQTVHGEGFNMLDATTHAFPNLDRENLYEAIETDLKRCREEGFSGLQEEIAFDTDGLLVGTHKQDSVVYATRLRAKDDFEELFKTIDNGKNFDATFEFDPATNKATISLALKKHELVPRMVRYQTRID
jgi:hypothetical protein